MTTFFTFTQVLFWSVVCTLLQVVFGSSNKTFTWLHFLASWSSGNAIISGARGLRLKSWAGQIERSVANCSPLLRHFFKRNCVAQAQSRGDSPVNSLQASA